MIFTSYLFILTSTCKPLAVSATTSKIKESVVQHLMANANLTNVDENEDSKQILSEAINDYKKDLTKYINITALNVLDKEDVELPNFDINYNAPTFGEIMYQYQLNLESSLTPVQLKKYDDLRRGNFAFDKYVALNQNKYLDLTTPPKYEHITTMSVVSTTLATILSGVGLTQAAISAFSGAVSTLSIAISTSWIPLIGWILAVSLAVGALIALSVIIIQYWDNICSVINSVKNWFLEEFNAFRDLIDSYFTDVVIQGEESKVAGREKIGNKNITWVSKIIKTGEAVTFLDLLRRNNNSVVLMRNIKKFYDSFDGNYYMSYWIFEELVTVDFVKDNNVYDLGVSTYTWYNNKAKDLMANGSELLEENRFNELSKPYEIGYHRFLETEEFTLNGFNHYHVFEYQQFKDKTFGYDKVKNGSISKAHSFFGLMYLRWPDGSIETYPTNP